MNLQIHRYHRAQAGPRGNAPGMLDAHFSYLAAHCHCVLPGEPLAHERLNVCLTFDDAYFDFYSVVFPLLEKHNLKAVLSVAPVLIREQAAFPDDTRTHATVEWDCGPHYTDGFCTWTELATLAASGRVAIAAQSQTHRTLDHGAIDFEAEIARPQAVLAERLGQRIESFVFPQGRFSTAALRKVREHYRYAFGIGRTANDDWNAMLLYRLDGDEIASPSALLPPPRAGLTPARSLLRRFRFC